MISRDSKYFLLLNVGHFLDHYFMLIFATVAALTLIGIFGSIYHPVGLAIVTGRWKHTGMRLAVNGVWGNLGVGCAALVTGFMIDLAGWRTAFFIPGIISIFFAFPYLQISRNVEELPPVGGAAATKPADYGPLWRVLICVYMTAVLGSIVFQSTTVALPEIFEERLVGLATTISNTLTSFKLESASIIGALAFLVFAAASLAQLVTGHMLDRWGARPTLALVTIVQTAALLLMPGLTDLAAFAVALGIMLGVFGQVPVSDFLIGTTASKISRSRAFGARYMVRFLAFSGALPLIAVVQSNWGFDGLFYVLMLCAITILIGSRILLLAPKVEYDQRASQ